MTVNWGDSTPDRRSRRLPVDRRPAPHVQPRRPYTVTVSVNDGDNTGTASFTVTVANGAPVVTAAADQTADEGVSASFTLGSFADAGAMRHGR